MATLVACAGFAAICGSSLATAATMTKVGMPPMRKFGYSDSLASASIAAGGTLGVMIPPSVIMVIYGLITQTSISKLFIAGILPGILGLALYLCAIAWTVNRDPRSGPKGEKSSWTVRLGALREVWGVALLFLVVIGGIYGGIFTSTEAAAIGASGALILAITSRTVTMLDLVEVFAQSAQTTATLFAVLIGALLFANFVNVADLPNTLQNAIGALDMPPLAVIIAILGVYIVLGCVMESISMILLTIPIFFPVVTALGYDPIWFGVLVVVVIEIGMITPPVGMNIFVLTGVQPDVRTSTVVRGLLPFIGADIVRLALLLLIPWISLALPSLM
jgi:tripartite ATP-independent transporter DctM subunit